MTSSSCFTQCDSRSHAESGRTVPSSDSSDFNLGLSTALPSLALSPSSKFRMSLPTFHTTLLACRPPEYESLFPSALLSAVCESSSSSSTLERDVDGEERQGHYEPAPHLVRQSVGEWKGQLRGTRHRLLVEVRLLSFLSLARPLTDMLPSRDRRRSKPAPARSSPAREGRTHRS